MSKEALCARVEEVVYRHLADITSLPPSRIRPTDRVVGDLKISGDDISFLLIPRTQKDLGVELGEGEWRVMRTVGDMIETFCKHLASK